MMRLIASESPIANRESPTSAPTRRTRPRSSATCREAPEGPCGTAPAKRAGMPCDSRRRAKVHQQFNAHVNLWRKPLPTCIPHAREACRSGLETGDFTYANYGVFTESWAAFFACRDFRLFVQDYSPNLELIRKLRMDAVARGRREIIESSCAGCSVWVCR